LPYRIIPSRVAIGAGIIGGIVPRTANWAIWKLTLGKNLPGGA
jgi:hypothetical protein